MSFHPDVINLARFEPHTFADLLALRAFPAGAVPEPAYDKWCEAYAAVDDVDVQRITYRSGGLAVTGVIAQSKGPANGKKSLVIYNRGGSGNFGLLSVRAIMTQFVPLARAGYVIVGSNYRGNDGGEGRDEFGGRDVDDVVVLHDLMRSHPLVDAKPCFTIGHSRGGMMTYLLIKRGLPMRAAIAIAAVADLITAGRDRQEMTEHVYKRYIPDFAKDVDKTLIQRSALYWPEALTVPLLLLHGTQDDRVAHRESVELAQALERLGLPHELVLYEGGNHALLRHWDDVLVRSLAWLERFAA